MYPTCPMCGGFGCLLGRLGDTDWFRCRQCGMEYTLRESLDACDYRDDERAELEAYARRCMAHEANTLRSIG